GVLVAATLRLAEVYHDLNLRFQSPARANRGCDWAPTRGTGCRAARSRGERQCAFRKCRTSPGSRPWLKGRSCTPPDGQSFRPASGGARNRDNGVNMRFKLRCCLALCLVLPAIAGESDVQ